MSEKPPIRKIPRRSRTQPGSIIRVCNDGTHGEPGYVGSNEFTVKYVRKGVAYSTGGGIFPSWILVRR